MERDNESSCRIITAINVTAWDKLRHPDPDPLRARFRPRLEPIHPRVHRVPARLEQLHLEPAEQRRQADVQLRVRELHPDAAARALAEGDHVARERAAVGRAGVAEPALRPEGVAGRE